MKQKKIKDYLKDFNARLEELSGVSYTKNPSSLHVWQHLTPEEAQARYDDLMQKIKDLQKESKINNLTKE